VEVRVTGSREPMMVNGDVNLLRSAIENVVRNAVLVSAAGAEVEIELALSGESAAPGRVSPGKVMVRVLDRGPGVPEQDLERIFEPFARIQTARDRASDGAGLGLAIARRGIESHGGTIRACPREGGGLIVEMILFEAASENARGARPPA
jgi:signal transduction histidine kinase